jgi:hypothetical protein
MTSEPAFHGHVGAVLGQDLAGVAPGELAERDRRGAQVRPGRVDPSTVVVVAHPDLGDVEGIVTDPHCPIFTCTPECWQLGQHADSSLNAASPCPETRRGNKICRPVVVSIKVVRFRCSYHPHPQEQVDAATRPDQQDPGQARHLGRPGLGIQREAPHLRGAEI